MKKKTITFAIVLVTAVALCLVLWLMLNSKDDTAGKSAEKPDGAIVLCEKPEDSLTSITVSCQKYQWKAHVDENGKLMFDGLEEYPLNEPQMAELRKYACLIRAQEKVDNANSDLSVYGLTAAKGLSVDVEYSGDDSIQFIIGDQAQGTTEDSFYTLYNGDVYIMHKLHIAPFMQKSENYINNTITPSNDNGDYVVVYLSVMDKDWDAPLTVSYDKTEATDNGQYMSSYKMASPYEYNITYNERSSDFLQSIFGMSGEIECVDATVEDLTDYGLSEPKLTVKAAFIDNTGVDYSLQFIASEADESGLAFVYLGGRNIIYKCDVKTASWYSTSWDEVVGKQIIMPSIKDVQQLKLRFNGEEHCVDLKYDGTELSVAVGGEEFSAEEFKKLYQVVISAEVDELSTAGADIALSSPDLEVVYIYKSGSTDKISFYAGEIREEIVYMNDKPFGVIRKTEVELLIDTIEQFLGKNEIIVRY